MTGNQLKDYIDTFQIGNYQVVVGRKGNMNALDVDNGMGKTHVEMFDGKIFIHEESFFTEERLNYYKTKEVVHN